MSTKEGYKVRIMSVLYDEAGRGNGEFEQMRESEREEVIDLAWIKMVIVHLKRELLESVTGA
jgi:hypothetical protein